MKDINVKPLGTLFKEVWQELCRLGAAAIDAIGAMSWPALLACAIGIAFVLTLLPLAITLFVIFVLVKWATGGNTVARHGEPRAPREQAHYGKD